MPWRASGGRARRARLADAGVGGDLGGRDRAAAHAAQHESGERADRGRLVEHAAAALPAPRPRGGRAARADASGVPLAVERVGREEPGRQLVRVQVPALEEPALERPAHESRVQPPRLDRAVADRQDVRRSVGEPDAGARDGELHDALREVGRRVLHRLVPARDAERGAVVVGAVVQAADAAGRGERRARATGDDAVGAEHELRRLDLHLEAQPSVGRPCARSRPAHDLRHRLDLRDRRHLRQREREAVGQAAVLDERGRRTGRACGCRGPASRPRTT